MGQRLHVGKSLLTRRDHAKGDYSLAVTSEDLVLQWKGQTYWKLSMGTNAIKYASVPVSFMTMNGTGLYVLGNNGSEVVFQFLLELSDMSFAKLDSSGILYISNIFERIWFSDIDKCQYPEACGKMGLCTNQTCTYMSNWFLPC
ncbi:putative non-specific serine/threonine protein kinase [Rosa chinensis]|uniref:Putative non-specific serine/threonine protein kinase n=1 Tax=Rosa chinensis TaxID=74649 RepID=A0A2P6PEM1_ROSCH|nr:putative non-specific serine/threonine protein kinase [Rosa chinensis]